MYSKLTLYCGEDARPLMQLPNHEGTHHSSLWEYQPISSSTPIFIEHL